MKLTLIITLETPDRPADSGDNPRPIGTIRKATGTYLGSPRQSDAHNSREIVAVGEAV